MQLVLENVKVVVDDEAVIIVDQHGNQYVVEPDYYPEIYACRPHQDDCYAENLRLRIREVRNAVLEEARAA